MSLSPRLQSPTLQSVHLFSQGSGKRSPSPPSTDHSSSGASFHSSSGASLADTHLEVPDTKEREQLLKFFEGLAEGYEKDIWGEEHEKHPFIKAMQKNQRAEKLFGDIQKLKRGSRFSKPKPDQVPIMDFTDRAITANTKSRAVAIVIHAVFQLIKLAKDHENNPSQKLLINKDKIDKNNILKDWFKHMQEALESLSFDRLKMIAKDDTEMLKAIEDLEKDFNDIAKPYFKEMTGIDLEPTEKKKAIMKIQTEAIEKYLKIDGSLQGDLSKDELERLNSEILETFQDFINKLDAVPDLDPKLNLGIGSDSGSLTKKVFTGHPCGGLTYDGEKNFALPDPINGTGDEITFPKEFRDFLLNVASLRNRKIVSSEENIVCWHGGDLDRTKRDAVALYALRLHLAIEQCTSDELKQKLLDLAQELKKVIDVLSSEYQDALNSLGDISSPLISTYKQHIKNLEETNKGIDELGQLQSDVRSSSSNPFGQLQSDIRFSPSNHSLGGITSSSYEGSITYDRLINSWAEKFNEVIDSDEELKNKLKTTSSQGRVPAQQLLKAVETVFDDINWNSTNEVKGFYEKLNDPDNPDYRAEMAKKIENYISNKDPKKLEDYDMIRAIEIFQGLYAKGYLLDVILADFSNVNECMAALCLIKCLTKKDVEEMPVRLLFENIKDVARSIEILNTLKDILGYDTLAKLSVKVRGMFANSDTLLRGGIAASPHTLLVIQNLTELGFKDIEVGKGSTPERGWWISQDNSLAPSYKYETWQPGRVYKLLRNPDESDLKYLLGLFNKYNKEVLKKPIDEITLEHVKDQNLRLLNAVLFADTNGITAG